MFVPFSRTIFYCYSLAPLLQMSERGKMVQVRKEFDYNLTAGAKGGNKDVTRACFRTQNHYFFPSDFFVLPEGEVRKYLRAYYPSYYGLTSPCTGQHLCRILASRVLASIACLHSVMSHFCMRNIRRYTM